MDPHKFDFMFANKNIGDEIGGVLIHTVIKYVQNVRKYTIYIGMGLDMRENIEKDMWYLYLYQKDFGLKAYKQKAPIASYEEALEIALKQMQK